MSDSDSTSSADSIEAAAAEWLARRDRGLSAQEQAAYDRWVRENARHATEILRLEKAWRALDRLAVPLAARPSSPDPDQLANHRHSRRWVWVPLLGAAAAVAFVYFSSPSPTPAGQQKISPAVARSGPESLKLEDGSIVQLKGDAKLEVQFTAAERRVRLVRGEAYFTVTKNPFRPFIVSANQVTVRAVGTAFSVDLGQKEISVLVTEGKVRVDEALLASGQRADTPRELSALVAGQQGTIALGQDSAQLEVKIAEMTLAQIDSALAWHVVRLEFVATPLAAVAAEFNRYNRRQLVVHDAGTGAILVGGNFRADNLDGLIRLLDGPGFGVSAFPNGEEIILRQTRQP